MKLRTKFEIPDPTRPIPESERKLGPSGHLIPFTPKRLDPSIVVGRELEEICPYVGTYGMGGPGYFGFRFDKDWLVIAVWGAADWLVAGDRHVGDSFYDNYGRPMPLLYDDHDELSPQIIGQKLSYVEVKEKSFAMLFENGMKIEIEEAPDNRPLMEGTKEMRKFAEADDLRDAVFLSTTTEIWV